MSEETVRFVAVVNALAVPTAVGAVVTLAHVVPTVHVVMLVHDGAMAVAWLQWKAWPMNQFQHLDSQVAFVAEQPS